MNYSVSTLTTVAECDLAIVHANEVKNNLEYRLNNMNHQQELHAKNVTEVGTELTSVNAELAAEHSIVASLPDGKQKKNAEKRVKQLDYRQFLLQTKQAEYNVTSQLNQQLDIELVHKQLEEVISFIAQVNARKGAL